MPDVVSLIEPRSLQRNPDNPRLVFRQEDLDALQESIAEQGILVPLTLYREGRGYRILDGERRWRCALKLGLSKVPAIIQPKPGRLQNIMMMFAIHHARKDWDPLPTALKLGSRGRVLKEALAAPNRIRTRRAVVADPRRSAAPQETSWASTVLQG